MDVSLWFSCLEMTCRVRWACVALYEQIDWLCVLLSCVGYGVVYGKTHEGGLKMQPAQHAVGDVPVQQHPLAHVLLLVVTFLCCWPLAQWCSLHTIVCLSSQH